MQNNKLQELTDKLYNEGLSKGKQDGEELLQKAKAESESIIAQAKAEAERIVAQAQREAEELKTKVAADVKMAAVQSISVTKQEMEKMVVAKMTGKAVAQNLDNVEFVKEMMKAIVSAFNANNASPVALDIIMPEALKGKVEDFVSKEIGQQFAAPVNVSFSKKMNGGFKVAPQGSGYVLQFTDEEFQNLIANYLRPATKKILFG